MNEPMIPKSMHVAAVQAADAFGYQRGIREATETLARIVAAAGGEVHVPDRLVVEDVVMAVDYLNNEIVYKARIPEAERVA